MFFDGVPSLVHLGPLSLAIHPWIGALSTGDNFSHCWGRDGESPVTVGPDTRTACITGTESIKSAGHRL